MHSGIVGGIQRFALASIGQHRPGAVVLTPRYPPGVVLAGDETTLKIARVAVGIVRFMLKGGDPPIVCIPPQRAMIGDVGEDQAAPVAHPDRSLRPLRRIMTRPVPDSQQRRIALLAVEPWIQHFPRGFGISNGRLPSPVSISSVFIHVISISRQVASQYASCTAHFLQLLPPCQRLVQFCLRLGEPGLHSGHVGSIRIGIW